MFKIRWYQEGALASGISAMLGSRGHFQRVKVDVDEDETLACGNGWRRAAVVKSHSQIDFSRCFAAKMLTR